MPSGSRTAATALLWLAVSLSALAAAGRSPPPVTESPAPAPLPAGPAAAPLEEKAPAELAPVPPGERRGVIIKTILGLVALLALSYLGGHPRVREWEGALGISQIITAGFPFVALGLAARAPSVGILSDEVLAHLAPLLRFGLGWIGFALGFRFNVRLLDFLPRGAASVVVLGTALPFAAIGIASGLVLGGAGLVTGAPFASPAFLRDALILGTAGAMTAETAVRSLARSAAATAGSLTRIVRLEELAGVLGLALVVAYFRPEAAGALPWPLPGTAWLFLSLGMGATMGFVIYAVLRLPATGAESILLLLGSVLFAAGMGSSLRLSPVVVCFVAGVLLANFPGAYKRQVREVLARIERPVYFLFLVIVGALWQPGEARGWLLVPVFVGARFLGKWLGAHLSWREGHLALAAEERRALVFAPMGALPVAIVVNAQLLYPGGSIPSIVTAVIGGAVLTELLVQIATRPRAASPAQAA